jgi:hypothetical protein
MAPAPRKAPTTGPACRFKMAEPRAAVATALLTRGIKILEGGWGLAK